jgi:hypothetical protein
VLDGRERQSRIRISNLEEGAALLGLAGADEQSSAPCSVADSPHGFDGIHDQVEDRLLRLHPIGLDDRYARREVHLPEARTFIAWLWLKAMTSQITSLIASGDDPEGKAPRSIISAFGRHKGRGANMPPGCILQPSRRRSREPEDKKVAPLYVRRIFFRVGSYNGP